MYNLFSFIWNNLPQRIYWKVQLNRQEWKYGTDQYDEKPCFDSIVYIKLKIFTHFHNIDSLNNSLNRN